MSLQKISNRIYLAIVITLIACNFYFSFSPIDAKNEGQRMMVQWWFVIFIAVWGAVGVWLSRKVGFPEMWDPHVPSRKWIVPAILGVMTGLGSILFDAIHPIAEVYGLKSMHHPLPEGIIVYIYGGLLSEILYHLLPVPLFLFLLSNLLLKRKHPQIAFWIVTCLLSFWESRQYFANPEQWNWIETGRHTVSYLANLFEIWCFRTFGFLAALEQRFASYTLWHIFWPALTGR